METDNPEKPKIMLTDGATSIAKQLLHMNLSDLEIKILAEDRNYSPYMHGRQIGKSMLQQRLHEAMLERITGNKIDYVVIDDGPFKMDRRYFQKYYMQDWSIPDSDNRGDHDWKRTEFKSGPTTPPSEAKRAKLRVKRKKKR